MANLSLTRRAFAAGLAAAAASRAAAGWTELFNGRDLTGWRPSENKTSWKVAGGQIAAEGPRSHLFYDGDFRNFELEVEALARPACNSGVYFHTAFQERGFPEKGFEIQINNTATGDGGYRERKKTGSLYGLRNVYKQFVADDRWFILRAEVRANRVRIRIDDLLVVDYVEPRPPVIPDGPEKGRFLDHGTFALQCHNDGSHARFRSVRVRPLPDDLPRAPEPLADDVFREIIDVGRHNIPMADFHVHLKSGLTLPQALEKSRRDGIAYGIAVNVGKGQLFQDEAGARQFLDSMKGAPCFVAMQAEGREWVDMVPRRIAAGFDYIFTDSMTWTDRRGKRMRLWIPEEVGTIADVQEFMDTLVERAVGILEHEPVDIYANPTYLPDSIVKDYETLWTPERRTKVIGAAVRNSVAIEINNRYKLPRASFIKQAKAAGAKFTFGSNNTGPNDLLRCEYGLQMVEECKLAWQDFFMPLEGPKAVDRKGTALRA